mgnify:CR=1 FL=1
MPKYAKNDATESVWSPDNMSEPPNQTTMMTTMVPSTSLTGCARSLRRDKRLAMLQYA